MWEAGQWDSNAIRAYLKQWQHRFDLLDDQRPFYQTPGLSEKMEPSTSSILACEQSSKNAATLFDHHADHIAAVVSPVRAACLVVANQAFNLGGLCSREKGGNPSAKDTPIARAAMALVIGDNLFETLMFNMVRYDIQRGFPFGGQSANDAPAWEQDSPAAVAERRPRGYLDYLTWQSRRIGLESEVDEGGCLQVRRALIADGYRFPAGFFPSDEEIMTAHMLNPRAESGSDPQRALRLRRDRVVWRDSTALFQSLGAEGDGVHTVRPRAIDWLATLVDLGVLDRSECYSTSVLGACSKPGQKKIYFWRHERQPIPLSYLTDEDLVDDLSVALEVAKDASDALTSAGWPIGRILAGPHPNKRSENEAVRKKLGDYLPSLRVYWSSLEPQFHELLLHLPGDYDHRQQQLVLWAEVVERTAWWAFDECFRALPTGANFLHGQVVARSKFAGKLYGDVLRDYKEVDYAEANRT